MICQVSLFTLKPDVTADRLEEMMWTTRAILLKIREVLHLNVGKRIKISDPWHWFVSIEAESLDKLAILQDDPHYYKFLLEVVHRSVETQQVMVFEMEPRKDVKYS
ncbi:Dabb family protein [Verrucomicrobium spinosum]|uniref:Dabb family protein n=1 Tax=Verrucomicrobium spinosum TaxID=2736 RepID=UPI00017456B8|nr:Dabb family protein [Verrucomicrobium spinosum]